ncbi:MAG: type I-B CRISPR-associated protein Cas8b1/Cst1 [Spirochaetes bacterium]|nr:MAG: type I-B CRISPR-associated protein Cas8b1/Cst1 [Spirochaetota bacterium]
MSERLKKGGLSWTGHPIVDAGVATLTAFAEKNYPDEVTFADLEKFVRYAEKAYFSSAISGYLTVLFTSNFMNPSWSLEKKKEYLGQILRSYNNEPTSGSCVYCKKPSVNLPTSDLAYRDLIPMLTGRGIANFFPGGHSGLSLCGYCLLAIQAIAIGAPMVSGRALIVSSDDPLFTLDIIKKWLPETRSRVQLSEISDKKPPAINRPLTRVIEAIMLCDNEKTKWREDASLTVYHLSNSGQGPSIDIFNLPSNITKFINRAKTVKYRDSWNEIIKSAWEKDVKGNDSIKIRNKSGRRNYLFEDLFKLPENAGSFIRTYFLRQPPNYSTNMDPRKEYKGWQDAKYVKWNLAELFLEEVIHMEKSRIEAIKRLGDRIAEEIVSTNDRGFWYSIYNCQKFYEMRNILIRQSQKCIKAGKEPLIRLDPFLEIFEEGEELARADWRLAWDLTLIRVIEQLYDKKWFEKNRDVLETKDTSLELQEA